MPELWRPLSVSGDVRALTTEALAARASESFRKPLSFLPFIPFTTLGASDSAHKFVKRSNGSNRSPVYHVPGVAPTSRTNYQSSVVATIDDILEDAIDLPEEDVQLDHFSDDVAIATDQLAYGNGLKAEQRGLRLMALAARSAAETNIHDGGNRVEITSTASIAARYPKNSTGAANAEGDLAALAEAMDLDYIPREGRVAWCVPEFYNALGFSTRVVHMDYGTANQAPLTREVHPMVQGFELRMSHNLPSTNVTDDLSKYNGDFSIGAATGSGRPVVLAMYSGGETPDGKPVNGPIRGLQKMPPSLRVYPDWEGCRITRFVHGWRYSFTNVDVWCAGEIALRSGS